MKYETPVKYFVSLGVVQSELCEQMEVSELVKNMELGEKSQCPCRATQYNSSSLLMVQNRLALQTLRCSLQPYMPKNNKGELFCVPFLFPLQSTEVYIKCHFFYLIIIHIRNCFFLNLVHLSCLKNSWCRGH